MMVWFLLLIITLICFDIGLITLTILAVIDGEAWVAILLIPIIMLFSFVIILIFVPEVGKIIMTWLYSEVEVR